MRRGKFWGVAPLLLALLILFAASVCLMLPFNRVLFFVELGIWAVAFGFTMWQVLRLRYAIARTLSRVSRHLSRTDEDALENCPLPVAVVSAGGEILWYSARFRQQVLLGDEAYGAPAERILGDCPPEQLKTKDSLDIRCDGRSYTVMVSPLSVRERQVYVLYYFENTRLKAIAQEYALSRPVVLTIYIDNLDELSQTSRDSERAQISSRVETVIEDWIGSTTGLMRKYGSGKFIAVVENRHLQQMVDSRFDVLDLVRAVQVGDITGVTLSIGVGQGDTFQQSEELSRQAVEMALGRGGDQAAVKTKNGFDFYGGVSKGVEKRTKVRTRVVASALQELIAGSDHVIVMGHRYSDLDCLGSAVAMAVVARKFGKPAYVAVNRQTTLAPELIERYERNEEGFLFIDAEDALPLLTSRSLLIITDTHNPKMLEYPELYQAAKSVVVIDHHRKMVDHIEGAIIFYHEPYASSASEMVAELTQYFSVQALTRLEAEALMAGIMLDTRSFVMKAGVRTFEAAAYLRKLGADTVEVKRLFSGSMDLYRKKSDIVSRAQIYKQTAIAVAAESGGEIRVAAAQAADELLSIRGVDASFTLFEDGGGTNISARSLGAFNVQLVMEALGGGGHMTMAGAFLKGTDAEQTLVLLKQAIDEQLREREHSLASHGGNP